jgi:hypothetical protein
MNSIKTPNLQIMTIEEGEEVQPKGICNIFNKIMQNFPNLEKVITIQVREACRKPNRHVHNRASLGILSLKQIAQRTRKDY